MSILQENHRVSNRHASIEAELTTEQADCVVDLVQEYLGRNLEYSGSNAAIALTLQDPEDRPLSVPERTAIDVLVKYCRDYAPGLRTAEPVTLPKTIDFRAQDYGNIGNKALMSFCDEERAYRLAEVVEECFDMTADVVQVRDGWQVVVSANGDGAGISAEQLARLQGACLVLLRFDVIPANYVGAIVDNANELTPAPEYRQDWQERKNAPMERIESKIQEILSLLKPNPATGLETAPVADWAGKPVSDKSSGSMKSTKRRKGA